MRQACINNSFTACCLLSLFPPSFRHYSNLPRFSSTMNRPRNRQTRSPRQQQGPPKGRQQRPPRESNTNVPSVAQVAPGAAVSIVLKQDQPTGREVQGIVQDLLTKGNHPRGIKVRLTDGRVGRVQRMLSDQVASQTPSQPNTRANATTRPPRILGMVHDVRNEEGASEPPPRTLLDFLPPTDDHEEISDSLSESERVNFSSASARCPICDNFEGDEAAVSHHVEEHLD